MGELPEHPSVILLGVRDEDELHRVRKHLIDRNVRHVHFYEPDRDDELTSIACEPVFDDGRKAFKKFRLLRMNGGAR